MEREEKIKEMFEDGMRWMRKKDYVNAIFCFEEMVSVSERNPAALSCLGLAMARGKVDLPLAEKLCQEALKKAPRVADYYRNLAEIYLARGKKARAIWVLKKGLAVDGQKGIIRKELKKFGTRQRPPIPFLDRTNVLNRCLGLLRAKLAA